MYTKSVFRPSIHIQMCCVRKFVAILRPNCQFCQILQQGFCANNNSLQPWQACWQFVIKTCPLSASQISKQHRPRPINNQTRTISQNDLWKTICFVYQHPHHIRPSGRWTCFPPGREYLTRQNYLDFLTSACGPNVQQGGGDDPALHSESGAGAVYFVSLVLSRVRVQSTKALGDREHNQTVACNPETGGWRREVIQVLLDDLTFFKVKPNKQSWVVMITLPGPSL